MALDSDLRVSNIGSKHPLLADVSAEYLSVTSEIARKTFQDTFRASSQFIRIFKKVFFIFAYSAIEFFLTHRRLVKDNFSESSDILRKF